MKRVIDHRVYDTDTAREMASWDNGLYVNDLGWVSETLYRKRTGEWFVFGEGGAATKYAKPDGPSSWVGGERVMPLTGEQAREWAERRLDGDEAEALFAPDDEPSSMTVHMPADVKAALDARAERDGATKGGIVVEALREYLRD